MLIFSTGQTSNLIYLGVFDGYDGQTASSRCSEQLHLAILDQLSQSSLIKKHHHTFEFQKEATFDEINNLDPYEKADDEPMKGDDIIESSLDETFHRCLKEAYDRMDKLLARGQGETSKVRWSGTTACSCLIEKRGDEGWVHIANCGILKMLSFIKLNL